MKGVSKMRIESVTKNTAVVVMFAVLMLSHTDVAVAYSQYIEEVTDETYKEKVYSSGKSSLVCFTFDTGLKKIHKNLRNACKYFFEIFEELAEGYHDKINFFEYNLGQEYIDEGQNPDNIDYNWDKLYRKYGVNSQIPTTIMYDKNGKVIDVLRGIAPPNRGYKKEMYKLLSDKWIQTNLISPNGEWAWRCYGSPGFCKYLTKPEE